MEATSPLVISQFASPDDRPLTRLLVAKYSRLHQLDGPALIRQALIDARRLTWLIGSSHHDPKPNTAAALNGERQ